MNNHEKLQSDLKALFSSQYLGVLATQNNEQPYTSLVLFAATDDMKHLLFVTSQETRKYSNLKAGPRVAMLIDSRTNQVDDILNAMAVTATGNAVEVNKNDCKDLTNLFLAKHPHLEEFVKAPSTSLIKLTVNCYYIVKTFQKATEVYALC